MSTKDKLIKAIRDGRVILWAGSGFSKYAGVPLSDKLIRKIVEASKDEERKFFEGKTLLSDVAEEFIQLRRGSRDELYSLLKGEIVKDYKNIHVHRWLTEIPQIKTIVTTNYDTLFETAYEEEIEVILHSRTIPQIGNSSKVKLYKIHGDFSAPENLIIAKSDYNRFFLDDQFEPLCTKIKALIAENSILFVGYSLEDMNVQFLFNDLFDRLGPHMNGSFFVSPNLPQHKQNVLSERSISYINLTGEQLIEFIKQETHEYLVDDVLDGNLGAQFAGDVFAKKGMTATFQMNERREIKKIDFGVAKGFENELDAKVSVEIVPDFFNEHKAFFQGHHFGELQIPAEKITNLRGVANGIALINREHKESWELVLKSIPLSQTQVAFLLKPSLLSLKVISAQFFTSARAIEFRFSNEGFELKINLDRQSADKGVYQAELYFKYNLPQDVVTGRDIFLFLSNWIGGDRLMVQNPAVSELVELPNEMSSCLYTLKNQIDSLSAVYQKLFDIQTAFGITITVPQEINIEDLSTVYGLYDLIKNKSMPISSIPITVTNKEKISAFLDGQVIKGTVAFHNLRIFVKLFNDTLERTMKYVEVIDAYIENSDDVNRMITENLPIKAIIGSKQRMATVDF